MIKKEIYLAGPLFTNKDVAERFDDVKILRESKMGEDFQFFAPIEMNKKHGMDTVHNNPDSFFFNGDYESIGDDNTIGMIVNLDNLDPGTIMEFGIAAQRYLSPNDNFSRIWVVNSDWRRGGKIENKFLQGFIDQYLEGKLYKNVEEIINEYKSN